MISNSIKLMLSIYSVLFLASCGVHIGNVRQTSISKLAVINKNYEYTRDRNTPFCAERFTYRALAGTYYPEFEDNDGIYYRGKSGAIQFESLKASCMKELPKITSFEWAGIYIPNTPTLPARLYVYSGQKPSGYQSVIPDDGQIKNHNDIAKVSPGEVKNPYENGFIPALILGIERNSIQFLRFQAEDNSLRSAITIVERPIQ